jgi:hypothetical protein
MVHGGRKLSETNPGRIERWLERFHRFDVPDYDNPEKLYMTRWVLVQTRWFSVYVHRFGTADPRPTLHDHPYSFVSFVIRGGYYEQFGYYGVRTRRGPERLVRRINVKRAEAFHVITKLLRVPTWTLVLTGPRRRGWGYLDPGGKWTRYDQHTHDAEFHRALKRREEILSGS